MARQDKSIPLAIREGEYLPHSSFPTTSPLEYPLTFLKNTGLSEGAVFTSKSKGKPFRGSSLLLFRIFSKCTIVITDTFCHLAYCLNTLGIVVVGQRMKEQTKEGPGASRLRKGIGSLSDGGKQGLVGGACAGGRRRRGVLTGSACCERSTHTSEEALFPKGMCESASRSCGCNLDMPWCSLVG